MGMGEAAADSERSSEQGSVRQIQIDRFSTLVALSFGVDLRG